MSRRELAHNQQFPSVSPELGELDLEAFDNLFEEAPDDALELLARMSQATDRDLAALSRRLAGRISLELSRTGAAAAGGSGRLVRAPVDDISSDLDVDASMDAILEAAAERRRPRLEELQATRWQRPLTAVCLLVDRSGSMNGERLACAALAAATCSWRAPAHFSVLAFSNQVIEIKGIGRSRTPDAIVADVLRLRGHGTTDVALALRAAARQLHGSSATRRLTVLLSDAEVTTGGDPVTAGRALDELVILAPADERLHADRLANATGARLAEVAGPMSVLDALQQVLR